MKCSKRSKLVTFGGLVANGQKNYETSESKTAFDLAKMDSILIRDSFNIIAMKTAMELRGCKYFNFEQSPEQRKTLLRSRSFAKPVSSWQELSEAIASHATRAAEKLRNEELVAKCFDVFFHTSLFNHRTPRHSALR